MKLHLLKIAIFLTFFMGVNILHSQCSFDPTITSPRLNTSTNPIRIAFCDNNDTETLSTQVYSSYQWYRKQWSSAIPNTNPWLPIAGATNQTYTITQQNDELYYFKVEVTQDGCTEQSPEILADGFAYGLPYIIATFQPGTFQFIGSGTYNVCQGASVSLENGFDLLYGFHTWYNCTPSGLPPVPSDPCIISGENSPFYTASTSGFYGFYACTIYCPTQCQFLGLGNFIQLNFGNFGFCSLSIDDGLIANEEINVYPNPTSQFLFIGKETDGNYKNVSIYDTSGKLLLEKSDHNYKDAIDVSTLAIGNYFILSRSSTNILYRNKFIKK
ncbi:T9SS type A sorting domain-containing protein [Flavobacterium sp.]|jgi:hypothetical protein|uniref:T9SS type A sorting domain-containing protein n=1 Tax=Flavobacterium sp. TaxID=239 RepID=UPI0037C107E3